MYEIVFITVCVFFFFQAEDGIRDLVRSRGLGDVYKRQVKQTLHAAKCELHEIDAVAYTQGPGLAGALLVGALSLIHI